MTNKRQYEYEYSPEEKILNSGYCPQCNGRVDFISHEIKTTGIYELSKCSVCGVKFLWRKSSLNLTHKFSTSKKSTKKKSTKKIN